MNKQVINPKHYTQGKIEVWDFIIDQKLNYLAGNIVKYIARYAHKHKGNPIQDLEKAERYLKKLINEVKSENKKAKKLKQKSR
tara:strand:+ start:3358 stop:3606 length:249 start_codon:yes stop_codon:yes gene_type:complete